MDAEQNTKNHDYSEREGDALSSFKDLAKQSGLTPLQCWSVLMAKHVLAIQRFILSGELKSESIHGRFVDLANYARLGDLLVQDLGPPVVLSDEKTPEKEENPVRELRPKYPRKPDPEDAYEIPDPPRSVISGIQKEMGPKPKGHEL